MSLLLMEMQPDDFVRRRALVAAGYAEAIAGARGLTAGEAAAEAERDIANDLPRGLSTPGKFIRKAVVDGVEVGWIWIALPDKVRPTMAWIYDIEVDPEYRSRGHAAAIITAAARELSALKVPRLGLNVFGDNGTAMRLYDRLGFEVTAQQLRRELDDVTPPDGIELVPMVDYERRIESLFADYAQDLMLQEGLWHGEAETRAAGKLSELLPRGAATDGMMLRTVLAHGVPVGWVWVGPPPRPRPGTGWLHNLEIDEGHRNRGYGRAVIAAVEADLVHRGMHSLGLNVHGANTGARRLYERLGYRLQSQQMVRQLE